MARLQEAHPKERLDMPQPGTLEYFGWLGELDIDQDFSHYDAKAFLMETQATRAFIWFIRHHRTILPLRRHHRADMDSRLMDLGEDWSGIFRGSVETNPDLPNHGTLTLHGQPNPADGPHNNYTYDVLIPISAVNYYAADYEPSRPIQAAYNWREYPVKDRIDWTYDELAFCEKSKNDPTVLKYALQEAARDLYDMIISQIGSSAPIEKLRPSPKSLASWSEGYLEDDANEFMPSA